MIRTRRADPAERARLAALGASLLRAVEGVVEGVREGVVHSVGPAPYLRLDCDGRALALLRLRPTAGAVRVDVTPIWASPPREGLAAAAGCGGFLVRRPEEVAAAVAHLAEVVRRTREARARESARAAARRAAARRARRLSARGARPGR